MKRVWHYINEEGLPPTNRCCLCRVKNKDNMHRIITAIFFPPSDWCDVEFGNLIADDVVCWADLIEVLSCIKEVEDET